MSQRNAVLRAAALCLALSACAVTRPGCAPQGAWVSPATLRPVPDPLAAASARPAILLGEEHDSAADHAWQLHAIMRLYAANPHLVLGFEMFPRSDQAVLDAWVAGKLTETAFLQQSRWKDVWGFPPELYLPIFRFARDHRIPMRALNVSRRVVHLTSQKGWAAVPVADREGVGDPAPPTAAYRSALAEAMAAHGGPAMPAGRLDRFIDAQLVWDRAMAEGIAAAHAGPPPVQVVAIMGAGHLMGRNGVPHQLAALGMPDALVLIPEHGLCAPEGKDYADAVFTD